MERELGRGQREHIVGSEEMDSVGKWLVLKTLKSYSASQNISLGHGS